MFTDLFRKTVVEMAQPGFWHRMRQIEITITQMCCSDHGLLHSLPDPNSPRPHSPHHNFMRFAEAAAWLSLFMCTASVLPACSKTPQSSAPAKEFQHLCQATTANNLVLDCAYRLGTTRLASSPHLRLIHASMSFEIKGESYMSLSLLIANEDTVRFVERRTVFIEIDDPQGKNYLRRALSHVDLSLIDPGGTRAFSEKLLVGSFLPGDYIISLWIPSPDAEHTYNSKRNFLLSGDNVADPETGLNRLAQFTVLRVPKR